MKSLPDFSVFKKYPGSTPYPLWISASSSLLLIPKAFNKTAGLPPPAVLFGLSLVYTGIGYLNMDDPVAGCSIASAWGLIHIFGFGKKALNSKRILPILHLGLICTSTGIYLKEFIQDF